jgi:hypothetical protein
MSMTKPLDTEIDPLNRSFAAVMETGTYIGLALMLLFGLLYLAGVNPAVPGPACAANWHLPSDAYWEQATGVTPHGYGWFLGDLAKMDNLTVFGVVILALAPVLSVLAAVRHAEHICRYLLILLLIEFGFAIFRPLILAGGGH